MAIGPVSALQISARDEAAGPHPELQVEGVPHESVFHRKTRKQARLL
jgi:hypothetical protein